MDAAGGEVELLMASATVKACVKTYDREGKIVEFHVIISEADEEILVSDSGIDALGIRIESFVPGKWRFSDETVIRETEPPQYW
jgi:predicted deacetylase